MSDTKLYFVTLETHLGDVLAGGHFFAKDATEAREIGLADFLFYIHETSAAHAKMAKGYAVKAKRSSANPLNALNRVAA